MIGNELSMYPRRIKFQSRIASALTGFAASSYYPLVRDALFVCFLCFSSLVLIGCNRDKNTDSSTTGKQNVLLITLDTTRADRIGCYGYAAAKTPALDALATRGVVFDDAIAQVPLTLPSHGTILTGRFPKEFGVRINNQGAIGDTHPTLATILKQQGYRTAAFVATFVLDSRFGLDRGFDLYDDNMVNMSIKSQPLEWEQPANIIADRAIEWLGRDKSKPFFAWLHFYDPHDPYTPPDPFPRDYNGEIAFMDTQIKRVADWLDASGQRERTLVVVVGDHGESFGEHGEEGHGMFLYNTSLHVPMIFSHPTLIPKPMRVTNTVGAVDVFPTVLDLLSIQKPDGLHSTSLVESIRTGKQSSHDVYSESDYVWQTYGWAQQRSFTNENWKFISSTRCELYDRKKDPEEKNNLCKAPNTPSVELSNQLAELYGAMAAGEAGKVAPSADAAAGLATLGYIEGGKFSNDEFLTESAADPKDMLDVVADFKNARKLMKHEKYAEAATLLQSVAAKAPDSLAIQAAHGMALVNAGRYLEGLAALKRAYALDAHHQPVLMNIGDAHFMMDDFETARVFFTLAVENDKLDPTAHYKLGKTYLKMAKPQEALAEFAEAARLFPEFPEARFELGVLFADAKRNTEALENYRQAVRLKPDHAQARYNYGRLLLITGSLDAASDQLREATRLAPGDGQAWINLGIALLKSGKKEEGKGALAKASQIPDSAIEAHMNLAIAYAIEGDRNGAIHQYKAVLAINPAHIEARQALDRLQSGS